MTQRFVVPGGGKSAIVNGLPSGAITNLILSRNGANINTLAHATDCRDDRDGCKEARQTLPVLIVPIMLATLAHKDTAKCRLFLKVSKK